MYEYIYLVVLGTGDKCIKTDLDFQHNINPNGSLFTTCGNVVYNHKVFTILSTSLLKKSFLTIRPLTFSKPWMTVV